MASKPTIFESRKTPITFSGGQQTVLEMVEKFLKGSDQFFLLAGYSGTGKTTVAENIANYAKATMLAPTNAAVNRLKEKIDNPTLNFMTIHACIYTVDKSNLVNKTGAENVEFVLNDKNLFIPNHVYIIDECSMIEKKTLEDLMELAIDNDSKLIFMGDSHQLEPIGTNPQIFKWEKSYKDDFFPRNRYELTEIKRYDGVLLNVATEMRTLKTPTYTNPQSEEIVIVDKFGKSLVEDIKRNNKFIVLTATNKKRVKYNHVIRSVKFKSKELTGQPIDSDLLISICNSNKYSNGEQFIFQDSVFIEEFEMTLYKSGGEKSDLYKAYAYEFQETILIVIPYYMESSITGEMIVNSKKSGQSTMTHNLLGLTCKEIRTRRGPIETWNKNVIIATYGYASSTHKAQGQEWDHVYIDVDWMMSAWDASKWFYTAITRAKKKVEIVQNNYLKILPSNK